MQNQEIKIVNIADKEFAIIKLEPWKRLTFIADLQNEFLAPVMKSLGSKDVDELFKQGTHSDQTTIIQLISSFSRVLDGKSIEAWMRRILGDGMVIYTREDGQKVKMSFAEINKLFNDPMDIVDLLKETIMFNLEGISNLLDRFKVKGSDKIVEAAV